MIGWYALRVLNYVYKLMINNNLINYLFYYIPICILKIFYQSLTPAYFSTLSAPVLVQAMRLASKQHKTALFDGFMF